MAVGVIFDVVLYSTHHNYLCSSCMEVLLVLFSEHTYYGGFLLICSPFFTYYFENNGPSSCSQAQDIGCLTTSKVVFQNLTGSLILCLAHCTKKYICRINYKCSQSSSSIKLLLKGLRNAIVIEKQSSDC